MEPFMFDHLQSHVPVNIWKLVGKIDLNTIANKNVDQVERITSDQLTDFIVKPIKKKNKY